MTGGLTLVPRRRARWMAAASLAIVAGVPAPRSAAAEVVLDSGHVDAVAPTLAGGQLTMKVKDGTAPGAPVFRDPGEVLFRVKPEARMTVQPGLPPGYAFLGAPGSTIWLLPQVQSDNPAVVWAGWSSESISAGQFAGDQVHWRLVGVDGPGPVQVYETDAFGSPRVLFNSADGLPDTELKPTGTHSHFNWIFHAAGLHRLRFEVSGTPAGAGAPITTGPVEYRFEVVGPAGGGGAGGGSGGGGDPGGGPGGGGQDGGAGDPSPTVRLGATVARARLKGRLLTLRLRVTRRSGVSVAVLRGKRVVARSKKRTVGASARRLRVRLNRRPVPGRYRVRVTVRSSGERVTRRIPMRVRAP
jgi:surface-anchored protein